MPFCYFDILFMFLANLTSHLKQPVSSNELGDIATETSVA